MSRTMLAVMVVACVWGALPFAPAPAQNMHRLYTGGIGRDEVFAELIFSDDAVQGYYYDCTTGKTTTLVGPIDAQGRFTASEFVDNERLKSELTGVALPPFASIRGTWSATTLAVPESFVLEKIADIAEIEHLDTLRLEFALEYPVFSPERNPAFRALNDTIQSRADAIRLEFLAEVPDSMDDETEAEPRPWQFEQRCAYELLQPDAVSWLVSRSTYTGGAHGNTVYDVMNFVIRGDRFVEIALDDFFTPGAKYRAKLAAIVMKELRGMEADWVLTGELNAATLPLDVFTYDQQGIAFHFAPYAVGSYAQGDFHVFVPFKKLARYIDRSGPAGRYLGKRR